MKIPKIKNFRQILPMVLLVLMLVVVLILKLKIPTNGVDHPASENLNLNTANQTGNNAAINVASEGDLSKINVPIIEDQKQKKRVFNEAVKAITDVTKIKNGDQNLEKNNPFYQTKEKQYWWDVVNLFGKEMIQTKKDDFTVDNYLEENKIKTTIDLTQEKKDFAVSLEVPNSKTVTSNQGDYIQYEFDQSTIVQYQLKENQLKENIIYNFKPNDNFFYFNVDQADNLEVIPKSDGGIIFQTTSEPRHIVATVTPPTVIDRKGNLGKITLECNDKRFKYVIDQQWLNNANYPVVVDPTLQLGAVLYYTGGTVNAEWDGDGSDYRDTDVFLYKDEVSLYSPITQYLISNIDYGDCNPQVGVVQLCNKGTTSFNLGDQYIGQELKFGNKVYQSDTIYYTGPAGRNPDNQIHAYISYDTTYNAYIIRFIRNHPTKNGMSNSSSVDIWLTGGLSDAPQPVDPIPTISPEPALSGLTCNNNIGKINIDFDTAGFSSTTTYAIKVENNGIIKYLQADNTLGNTELFRTRNDWDGMSANGLTAEENYNISISAKPNGTGTALAYSTTKNTTKICSSNVITPTTPGQNCGDGIIQFPEQCDDGNTNDGDGCDHTCNIEPASPSNPPTVDIKINGSDSSVDLPNNSSVTLSWENTGTTTSCSASGSWSGSKNLNSSEIQGPLATGTYTYTLQCAGPGGTSQPDSVSVTILPPPCDISYPYAVWGDLGNGTHWSGTVCVNTNLWLNPGNTLTIDPGTVVKFYIGNVNERWTLRLSGHVIANGGDNIYFTSYKDNSVGKTVPGASGTPQPGDWNQLDFQAQTGTVANTINNFDIRYATTGLVVDGFNNNGITNSTFRNFTIENCSSTAMYISLSDPTVESGNFRNNGGYAIYMDRANWGNNVELLGNNQAYNNQQGNAIYINAYSGFESWIDGTLGPVTNWYNDLPYIIGGDANSDLKMYRGITLNVEKGAIVKFVGRKALTVDGTFNALGTVANPIYFTSTKDDQAGAETHPEWFDNGVCKQFYPCDTNNDGAATMPVPGEWGADNAVSIIFNGYTPSQELGAGTIQNAVIRYAKYALTIYGHNITNQTEPTLENLTLEYNSGQGIYIDIANPTLKGYMNIRNNGGNAIYLGRANYGTNVEFTGTTVFDVHDNGLNGIYLNVVAQYESYLDGAAGPVTNWYNDLPYVIGGALNADLKMYRGVTLNVEKGAIIKFIGRKAMTINGTLNALGTAANPIYFTSTQDDQAGAETHPEWFDNGVCRPHYPCDTNNDGTATTPAAGDWGMDNNVCITFNGFHPDQELGAGTVQNTIIRYAKNALNFYGYNVGGQTEPVMENLTVENNSGTAIYIDQSNPTLRGSIKIKNNGGHAIFLGRANYGTNVEFNDTTVFDVHDNATNGIYLNVTANYESYLDGTAGSVTHWYNDLPYLIGGQYYDDLKMYNYMTLQIEPGAMIKFDNGKSMTVNGTLNAMGTVANPIYFTSIKDDQAGVETHPEWFSNGICKPHYPCDLTNDGTATAPAAGDWGIGTVSIIFNGYTPSQELGAGTVKNTTIRYATNALTIFGHNIGSQTEPTLENLTLENNLNSALYVDIANPTLSGSMTIRNNGGYAIYLGRANYGTNVEFNGNSILDVHDNAINGIVLNAFGNYENYLDTNTTWYKYLPYYIAGDTESIKLYAGLEFNVQPGAILKFRLNKSYISYGQTNFNGTTEEPIYITSIKDDQAGMTTHPEWFTAGVCKSHYPCDTNNDEANTAPAKGDWNAVVYSNSLAYGQITNTTFRYGAGGGGIGQYELSLDNTTGNLIEVENSNFNFTNAGLYVNNSGVNIHNNNFDSSSDIGVVFNNPLSDTIFTHNNISHFDTGILIQNASGGLTLENNIIDNAITGVWGQNISSNGVLLHGNKIDASLYYVRNDSSPFVSGSCASPSTSTTINACVNNWGSYPVTDAPSGKMNKNPGNILYNNYGVTLTAPNGSEAWVPHSVHNITWTTFNSGGNSRYADLYYSVDGGINWTLIAQNIDNQGGTTIFGEYAWTLPNTVSALALVKVDVKDVASGLLASDVSDNYFSMGYGSPQLSDTLSTVRTNQPAVHEILYTNDIANTTPIANGSIKFDLADEFDFTNLVTTDLAIQGADVSWGAPIINQIDRTIVYPFSGNLSKNDGTIVLTLGGTNKPINPIQAGDYTLTVGLYQSSDGSGEPIEQAQAQVNINDGLIIEVDIPTTLEFSVGELNSGINVNGAATNVASTATAINYGRVTGGENKIAAHELTVSTNCANGYQAQIKYSGPFSGPVAINDFTGSNANPLIWLVPNNNGYFGYTTDNSHLKNGQADRFTSGGGNKWAAFTTNFAEVAAADAPVENEATKIGYRFNLASNFGTSGVYQTEIMYLVTSSY